MPAPKKPLTPASEQDQPNGKLDPLKAKEDLLKHPLLWRGQQLTQPSALKTLSTGFTTLDRHLPGHGWPLGGLVELLLAHAGIGELRLLLPALAGLHNNPHGAWSVWVNPPFVPYAPALQTAGVDSQRLLLVHPKTPEDFLWAVENACKSASCGVVLAWPFANKLKPQASRRIQIMAKQGQTLACLFQPLTNRYTNSMAELRLALHPDKNTDQLILDICKRRGGWPINHLKVTLTEATTPTHMSAEYVQHLFMRWQVEQQRQRSTRPHSTVADNPTLTAAIEANLVQPHGPTTSHALH